MATNTICTREQPSIKTETREADDKKNELFKCTYLHEIYMKEITWATTSEIEAEPTMTLYLCLRSIPAWIHALEQNNG